MRFQHLPRKFDTRALSLAAKPPPSLRFPAALEQRWERESHTSLQNFLTLGKLLLCRLCIRKARLQASWNPMAWAEFLVATMYGLFAWERHLTKSQSPVLRRKMMQDVATYGGGIQSQKLLLDYHTNHIFCESLWLLLYTSSKIYKYRKNAKYLKDRTCAMFFKSRGFKNIKYDIPACQKQITHIQIYIL